MSRRARQRASARPWAQQHARDLDAAERLEALLSGIGAPRQQAETPSYRHPQQQQPTQQEPVR